MGQARPSRTSPGGGRRHKARLFVGLTLGLCALGLVLVRGTVGWVFPVTSGSMSPTIREGEWVFVLYGADDVARRDIVVVSEPDGGAMVKRVAAMDDDRVRVDASGDLRVGGELGLPSLEGRPLVPLFDSRLESITSGWRMGPMRRAGAAIDELVPWERLGPEGPGETWRLDGRAIGRGQSLGMAHLRRRVDDGWLDPDGTHRPGKHLVHDLVLDCQVKVAGAGGYLHFELTEQGDVFLATVPIFPGRRESFVYLRREALPGPFAPAGSPLNGAGRLELPIMARGLVEVPVGRWVDVRFTNVDNVVAFEIDGQRVASDPFSRNTPHPSSTDGSPFSPGERVHMGGWMIDMEVRNVVVSRDLYYLPRGRFGVEGEQRLQGNEVYLLGDASAVSRDSRERGPVRREDVVGEVRAVVWPPGRARVLR